MTLKFVPLTIIMILNRDSGDMRILVTGVAGFIGSNIVKAIYRHFDAPKVVGVDSMNEYYDIRLKEDRLAELEGYPGFTFVKGSIADKALIDNVFDEYKPQVVVNLAAQTGVRYSISSDFIMCWRLAVVMRWSIWCMLLRRRCMVRMRRCRIRRMTRWTILSLCMRLPRRATS